MNPNIPSTPIFMVNSIYNKVLIGDNGIDNSKFFEYN